MALLRAATSEDLAPVNVFGHTTEKAFQFTGQIADNNAASTTAGTFVVPAVGSTTTVAVTDPLRTPVGADLKIDDSTHTIIALVTALSGTTATVQTVSISAGSAGNTMASGAIVSPATNATFTVAAVGSTQSVQMGSAAHAALFPVGDTITITGSADTIIGLVTAVSGRNLTVQTTTLSVGSAGDTMSTNAIITGTSGDRILFGTIPAYCTLDDLQVIMSATNASVTVSAGFFATDGTEYSHVADLIAASTALATATRIRANAAVAPPLTDKPSYLCLVVGGATITAATVLTAIVRYTFQGNP